MYVIFLQNGDLPRDVAFENGYCKIEAILDDHEKRTRRKQLQQRATSDYDIAAYLLGMLKYVYGNVEPTATVNQEQNNVGCGQHAEL